MTHDEFDSQVNATIHTIEERLARPTSIVEAALGTARMIDRVIASCVAALTARDDRVTDGIFTLDAVGAMLKSKNRAYGNSALHPMRCFSDADPVEGLRVRIDDKLSRLARGSNAGEDTLADLLGYLVMLEIAEAL